MAPPSSLEHQKYVLAVIPKIVFLNRPRRSSSVDKASALQRSLVTVQLYN